MIKKKDLPHHIVDAAMQLIGERGWIGLSLAEVASRSKLPLTEVVEHFDDKTAILSAYVDEIDRRMLTGETDTEGDSPRDRLFEVLMRRFDAMLPHRPAINRLAAEIGADPWAALCGAQRGWRSMALALEAAGISSSGLSGAAKVQGLAAIHLSVLRVWLNDDSADLSKTMAALDRALRRAEWLVGLLWRRRWTAAPVANPSMTATPSVATPPTPSATP